MKNEYRDIMNHISLSDEEKINILANAEIKAHKPKSYLKPILASACVLLIAFLGYKMSLPKEIVDPNPNTLTPNPMQRFEDVEAAGEAVGFTVSIPVLDNIDAIFVINGEIVQIKGQYAGQAITFRMGQGSEDISGDFNVYENETSLLIQGHEITAKGNGDLISLVLWQTDEFTYSIHSEGLSEEKIAALIESMTSA